VATHKPLVQSDASTYWALKSGSAWAAATLVPILFEA
jgi:hypothetical protein